MASFNFSGIGISHIYGCVPENTIINSRYTNHFSKDIAEAIVDKTGIEQRRFAEEGVCSSDMCFAAAQKLLDENEIDRGDIKFLVFVSQTPDYRMPATGILLQERLGLSENCMAFDLSLGCSGFVYGLSVIYGLVQSAVEGKGLLLVGETRSKVYSPQDRKTAFLFGDAGVACLIDRDVSYGSSFFDLYSDGSNGDLIKIKGGGYRFPSSWQTLEMKVYDSEGNIASDEHGQMNGSEVFNFVLQKVPKGIHSIVNRAELELNSFDCYVFHQANSFMNNHLVKKMKLDVNRVLSNVKYFGNTSSVSIPLAIVTEYDKNKSGENKYSLISGFGVGMSWANGIISLRKTKIGKLIEC